MAQNVEKGSFEPFDASNYRVGVVVAQFNRDIGEQLVACALEKAKQYRLADTRVKIFRVTGSIELPVVLQALAKAKEYDGLVALGVIIRGETPHFDYVAKIASEGILRVMLDYGIPIGFGVLTCDTREQALARVHVGADAMTAALHAVKAIKPIQS